MFSSVTEVSPMTTLRQRMLEDLRIRNYARTTVECYVRSVAEFAQHFNKPPDQLGAEEVRSWQLFLLNEKRVKFSTYIQAICALRRRRPGLASTLVFSVQPRKTASAPRVQPHWAAGFRRTNFFTGISA